MKIHHLGIVVTDVDEALTALGLTRADIKETVFDPQQKNNLHFIHVASNDLWIELVEPKEPDSTVANFARKNGLGLHHLAMSSKSLATTEGTYADRPGNFVLGRYRITVPSFGGKIRTLFVTVRGLLLEFIE